MEIIFILKWLHIIGATVLTGTGAGIAFFMVMAHRSSNVTVIAHTASIVVIADTIFTAAAAIAQPITGILLAHQSGWNLNQGWILASIGLYIFIGIFWLPVVWIQIQIRNLALQSTRNQTPLPPRYYKLYRIWFAFGFPAFFAILLIYWLMIAKPNLPF